MSRILVYEDGDREKSKIPNVQAINKQGTFWEVTYRPLLGSGTKTTNVRRDRVIRYDE